MEQRLTVAFVFAICLTAWTPVSLKFGALNIRPSQIVLPCVLLLLFVKPRRPRATIITAVLFVTATLWWCALLASSLLNNVPVGRPLGHVFLLGINIVQGVAVYSLVVRTRRLRQTVLAFLKCVAALNVFYLVVTLLQARGITIFQSWFVDDDAPMLVDGVLTGAAIERYTTGVLIGCVSAAAFVIAAALLLRRHRSAPVLLTYMAAAGIGIVIGFSRQAIVSLAAGLLLLLADFTRLRQLGRVVKITTVAAAVALTAIVALNLTPGGTVFVQALGGRTLLLFDAESYTGNTAGARLQMWSQMWDDIETYPILGRGQDAYLPYTGSADEEGSHNLPLEVLHSAGLVGFLPYAVFHLVVFLWGFAALRRLRQPVIKQKGRIAEQEDERLFVLGLVGALVATLLASFTNLIFWNPVYWMVVAFVAAAGRLSSRAEHKTPLRTESLHLVQSTS